MDRHVRPCSTTWCRDAARYAPRYSGETRASMRWLCLGCAVDLWLDGRTDVELVPITRSRPGGP